jgi:predicted esterase
MKNKKWWKYFKIVWFTFVTLLFIWNWTTFQSRNLPKDTFTNTDKVTVITTDDQITFQSDTTNHTIEVIFFQGGLTDPKAYAPLCKQLAENGFTTHLIKMNWRMPQHDYKKVLTLFDLKKGKYIIGGHSQGGKIAAQMVYENPNVFKGLFLMGTSHPRDIDLSSQNIPCLKLNGQLDGLASVNEVMDNKTKLPKDHNFVMIKGGNHSQFGYLGTLLMDNSAKISLAEQQKITIEYLVSFLEEVRVTK